MTNKPELTDELHYGDNVLWFLNELASFEPDDIDYNDFDVYGEHESGAEGTASVGIVELAADAVKLITKLQAELQERRKADSAEPLAWTDEEELRDLRAVGFCEMFSVEPISKDADIRRFIPLYRHAQPVPERVQIRREHAEWSESTFGNVGPVGPLKHLSKEALEAAAVPSDPLEWADMQFLLWDAQRRAGITDEQITQAMIEKLAINKARQWPEPKDGEPRLHIKEQPAPVVPDGLRQALSNAGIAAPESDEMLAATCEKYIQMLVTWVKDRKPFQPVPVVPEKMSKHALFEVAIARFSKMNEGFPIKRFKADWVISWMLENFPPAAQKQGDN